MHCFFSYENLLKNICPDDIILTVSHRLANSLCDYYSQFKSKEGKKVWVKPNLFSFSVWLSQLWSEISLYNEDLLLTESQEYVLWKNIIEKTNRVPFNAIPQAAKLAGEAMALIHQHQLDFPFKGAAFKPYLQFETWFLEFQAICQKKNWIPRAELPFYLERHYQAGKITPPKKIILTGFNELNKANQSFIDTLQALGTAVERYVATDMTNQKARIEIDTVEEEVLTMARWAKQIWQQNPSKNLIGCVVPKLDQRRTEVLNAFRQVFIYHSFDSSTVSNDETLVFSDVVDLSAPTPLNEFPLVAIVQKFFELDGNTLPLEKLGSLLRTPFIAAASQEWLGRSSLYHYLRSLSYDVVATEKLFALANKADETFYCPVWFRQLKQFRRLLQDFKTIDCFPSQWVDQLKQALEVLGWPGERDLTKEEDKIAIEFQKTLKDFAGLDHILNQINWETAKTQLFDLISKRLLQTTTHHTAPIQILGSLEAIGVPFTHVWVLGLTDDLWPAKPHPHPLLPNDIQIRFNLPHCSAQRELAFCHEVTQEVCRLSSSVIFSSARFKGDLEQKPSQLLKYFPAITTTTLALKDRAMSFSNEEKFEYLQDDSGPSIALGESIKGGAYVFKLQAACAFRAFAEIRLNAKALDKIRIHFNVKEKGIVVHRVLETIWRVLQTHDRLMRLSPIELHELIEHSVKAALSELYSDKDMLNAGFNRLEQKRLIYLIKRWIEHHEKPRQPFRIHALEAVEKVTLKNNHYTFKMDRIDEVIDSQQKIVIDYKTGLVSKENWFGERPNEPQLPLYCVTSHLPIAGLLFAQIKSSQLMYRGIVNEGIEIEGAHQVNSDIWAEQKKQWKMDLENLATQFTQGYAKVDPKEDPNTCRFCSLKTLCRV